jgi:hypothetical protein
MAKAWEGKRKEWKCNPSRTSWAILKPWLIGLQNSVTERNRKTPSGIMLRRSPWKRPKMRRFFVNVIRGTLAGKPLTISTAKC